MSLKIEIDGNDVSDYVIACGKIPLAGSRNRNKTPIIGEFDMEISQKCTDTLQGDVDVYLDSGSSYPEFVGTIIKNKTDYNNSSYKLRIRSKLGLLKDKILSHENLLTAITAGSSPDYVLDIVGTEGSEYNFNAPSARVSWIIECMMDDAGVDFDFDTGYESTVLAGAQTIGNLRFDLNMLWCLNQSWVGDMTNSYGDNYHEYRISYWDFISKYCGQVGAKIELSTSGTAKVFLFKVIDDTGTMSISNDDIYDQDIDTKEPEAAGAICKFHFANTRDDYQHAMVTTFAYQPEVASGEETDNISIYNNWLYLYEYGDYIQDISSYTNTAYFPWQYTEYINNDEAKLLETWDIKKVNTDLTFQTHARENNLIVEKQELEIIFEST